MPTITVSVPRALWWRVIVNVPEEDQEHFWRIDYLLQQCKSTENWCKLLFLFSTILLMAAALGFHTLFFFIALVVFQVTQYLIYTRIKYWHGKYLDAIKDDAQKWVSFEEATADARRYWKFGDPVKEIAITLPD